MRTKIIRGLSAIIKVLAAASAVTAYFNPEILPARYALPALIVLGCVSASKDFLITFCDILDDGKRNGSFDVSKLGLIALLCCCVSLVSCVGFVNAAGAFMTSQTGQVVMAAVTAQAKQLENTWEAEKIPALIDKANAAIEKLPARTGNPIKDLGRDMQEKGWVEFIALAQQRYKTLTGGKYVRNVVP